MEVRSSLKSFGTGAARPFAWLGVNAGGATEGRPGAGLASGLGGLAQLGSSLGGLAVAEGDGRDGLESEESGHEAEVRWSAAQPVYNDFEL